MGNRLYPLLRWDHGYLPLVRATIASQVVSSCTTYLRIMGNILLSFHHMSRVHTSCLSIIWHGYFSRIFYLLSWIIASSLSLNFRNNYNNNQQFIIYDSLSKQFISYSSHMFQSQSNSSWTLLILQKYTYTHRFSFHRLQLIYIDFIFETWVQHGYMEIYHENYRILLIHA